MVVLLVGVAGLAMALPSRPKPSSVNAKDLDEEQLRETVNLIEKFVPPIFEAVQDGSGDLISRMHRLVDSSLLLSREALKVRDPKATNEELIEEVQAARETMPLILDIMRASTKTFNKGNNPPAASTPYDISLPEQYST